LHSLVIRTGYSRRLHLVWKEKEKENDDSASKHAQVSLNHHRIYLLIPAISLSRYAEVITGERKNSPKTSSNFVVQLCVRTWKFRSFPFLFLSFSLLNVRWQCRVPPTVTATSPPARKTSRGNITQSKQPGKP